MGDIHEELKDALSELSKKQLADLDSRLEFEDLKPPMIRISVWEYTNLHKRVRELEAALKNAKRRKKR
jgi:BMFP domain-containing protein YqiC